MDILSKIPEWIFWVWPLGFIFECLNLVIEESKLSSKKIIFNLLRGVIFAPYIIIGFIGAIIAVLLMIFFDPFDEG